MSRILVVDDEPAIRNLLKVSLEAHKFEIALAENGANGLKLAAEFHPHLVILDLGLPDMNGLEVLKKLREWTTIPVLILTVSDDEPTKVRLLDAGADDYLSKPFGTPELLARIRVGLRHHNSVEATPIFRSGTIEVDLNSRSVKVGDQPVKLTSTEFELLKALVRNHGKVVHQDQLLKEVWGPGAAEQSHYLRIYIGQLRKKLESNPAQPQHLITEPGIGYRII
ncbi:MAG: response regulator [Bdellovibrionia bacterium]